MAKSKESQIEQCLRRVVQEAKRKDEEISVKAARGRAEAQLQLEAGFFKGAEWKQRSKEIIEATFQGEDEDESEKEASPAPQPAKPTDKEADARSKPQQRSEKASTGSPTTVNPPTRTARAEAPPKKKQKSGGDDASKTNGTTHSDAIEHERGCRDQGPATTKQQSPPTPAWTAPQINGVKRKVGSQSGSSSTSPDEEETESDEEQEQPQKKKAKTDAASSSAESSEDSAEDDGNPGDGNTEHKTGQERNSARSAKSAAAAPPKTNTSTPIPPNPFKPPSGYVALESPLTQSHAFSDESLGGKQIWYISAPSSVPLSSITTVAAHAIQTTSTVLTHKGADYVLQEDDSRGQANQTVFVPNPEGYECIQQPVVRSLQLRQKITLPDLNLSARQASQVTGSQAAADVAQAPVSKVRPQPKGLRMRYRPPGFGAGKLGRLGSGSDSTDEDGAPGAEDGRPDLQFPKALGVHEESGRRKGDNGEVAGVETLPEKAKKKRKGKQKDVTAGAGADEVMVNGVAERDTVQSDNDVLGPDLPNGLGHDGPSREETKEERRKRKEEKRARKEARRKAHEAD